MNRKLLLLSLVVSLLAVGLFLSVFQGYSQEPDAGLVSGSDTAFSYQGYLSTGSNPAEGQFDFSFVLHSAVSGVHQVGSPNLLDDVTVSGAQFSVQLDFGDVFDGTPLWLEIGVTPDKDSEPYTILSPRHALGVSPYAGYAYRSAWSGLEGIPAELADGDSDVIALLSCDPGQLPKWDGSKWACAADDDTWATLSCPDDQILRRVGSAWVCSDDRDMDTTYSAGGGLELIGNTLAISSTFRLPQTCDPGQITEWNGVFWDCGADDVGEGGGGGTITGVFGGDGLIGSATSGSVTLHAGAGTGIDAGADTLSIVESYRLPQLCANGQIARWNNSLAAWECDQDEDVLATLPCSNGEIPKWDNSQGKWLCAEDEDTVDDTVSYAEISGIVGASASTVAAGDHGHDDTYYTQSDFITGTAIVDWSKLISLPAGLSDGDDDTLASLDCTDGLVAKRSGSSWVCADDIDTDTTDDIVSFDEIAAIVGTITETVAAGNHDHADFYAEINHDHDARYYTETELQDGAGIVHWNNLFEVPEFILDGDDDTLASLTCGDGEIAKWNGGFWGCSPDEGGAAGSITGIAAGEGLYGGGSTGEVDLHIGPGLGISVAPDDISIQVPYRLPQGCGTGQLPKWDDFFGEWFCDADFDGLGNLFCDPGEIPQFNGSIWTCVPNGNGWALTGNSGTLYGSNYLGTTDNVSLTLAVSGTAALRLEPTAWSPNLIGGVVSNSVTSGVYGATIGGGGSSNEPHVISEHFGTIGGGTDNTVGDGDNDPEDGRYGTVGGGAQNTASSVGATAGGGTGNTASNAYAVVAGGYVNEASGYMSAVGGGSSNVAGNFQSTVSGGLGNLAYGNQSTIGGGENNQIVTEAQRSTIAGGFNNIITGTYSTIGGGSGNLITGTYSTIAGGGPSNPNEYSFDSRNKVSDDYGTIGGGGFNEVGNFNEDLTDAEYGTVSGGRVNAATGYYATVGGGANNIASTSSTVAGGVTNRTYDEAGSISGGWSNSISGGFGTIGGGANNIVSATYGTIAGGNENYMEGLGAAIGGGEDNWNTGDYATIGGGSDNIITGTYGTIAGGGPSNPNEYSFDSRNKVSDDYGTIGGGGFNEVGNFNEDLTDAEYGTVSGGRVNAATGYYATVGGGANNIASTSSTVAGGVTNRTYDEAGSISGGWSNSISGGFGTIGGGANNIVSATYGTIAGGNENYMEGLGAAIGGGEDNWNTGDYATIGGGSDNIITGTYGTIAGGGPSEPENYEVDTRNRVSDNYGAIGGGGNNRVGNFNGNLEDANYATVGGGFGNLSTASYATVAGGNSNTASGVASFAAGNRANAGHSGSFVWSDTLGGNEVVSDRADQFKVQAWGGTKIEDGYGLWIEMNYADLINTSSGTYLDTAGVWHQTSDREAKENFETLDSQEVLTMLAEVPITAWNYKTDDDSTRHIGPVAQDFYEAFGFGNSDTTIATIDVDGVALASVQALYERSLALEVEKAELKEQLSDLEARLEAVENDKESGQKPIILYITLGLMLLLLFLVVWLILEQRLIGRSSLEVGGEV